jgi:signal transduction histidine kinase
MDTRVFRALHDIAVAVGGVLEPVSLARLIADHARELLAVNAVAVYTLDETGGRLQPIFASDAVESHPESPLLLGAGAAGQAFVLGQPVLVDDLSAWPLASPWALANGVRSVLAVPLTVNHRRTGVVAARTYSPRHWTTADAETLTLLAAQIAPTLEAARLHERTHAARQQAEAAIKLRDEVLAGVSHDLAGPLARIRLYAELIQAESAIVQPDDSAEQLNGWSERIVAATISMKSLMQELVDVARLQMGHALSLDLSETDLVGLARRLVGEHQAAGRLVTLQSNSDHVVGLWDEPRLSRVVGNLLDNALNYSPPSTWIEVNVDALSESQTGDLALLQVRDRGRGIPPDDLPRVFERYFRGSNVATHASGSGLGLAVARQIVEQHGGAIDIESELGTGTLVSLRLPCTGPAEPAGSAGR